MGPFWPCSQMHKSMLAWVSKSKILTDTAELGVLVPYPDEGRDARDHLLPSPCLSDANGKWGAPWEGALGLSSGLPANDTKERNMDSWNKIQSLQICLNWFRQICITERSFQQLSTYVN